MRCLLDGRSSRSNLSFHELCSFRVELGRLNKPATRSSTEVSMAVEIASVLGEQYCIIGFRAAVLVANSALFDAARLDLHCCRATPDPNAGEINDNEYKSEERRVG